MTASRIEWTEEVWNPTSGCDRVSPGCDRCYALVLARRLKAMGNPKYQRDGDPRTSGPGFGLTMHDDVLLHPLRWRRPRRVFVNSMSDLFHRDVTDDFLAAVFAVMSLAREHTFQVLTKRHGRMHALVGSALFEERVARFARQIAEQEERALPAFTWPVPNVWLGVSAEDQERANLRVPVLVDTPAAVRFVSFEPLLGPVSLREIPLPPVALARADGVARPAWHRDWPGFDWVIIGGESQPGARRMDPEWVRDLVAECRRTSVAPFVKQLGTVLAREVGAHGKGTDPDEWPWPELRVREYPRAAG